MRRFWMLSGRTTGAVAFLGLLGVTVGCFSGQSTSGQSTSGQSTSGTSAGGDPGESMTIGGTPPTLDNGTLALFDGRSWSQWRQRDGAPSQWVVQDDRSVLVKGGDAVTAEDFGDFQLHLEFRCPPMPGKEGQAKGNSGVYIHGRYEVQVLDTFGQDPPAMNGCGALYSISPPMVNASRPAGEWQTYDMMFRAPRFGDTGSVTEYARITVLHNGIVIHNNLELPATTPGGLDREVVEEGPILLQDHGDPVRYRNIWIRRL